MSMNLHCKEMSLWQTPTTITYMCYSNGDGGWKGIRYRYLKWVRGSINGSYESKKAREYQRETINLHVKEVMSHKKIHFYIL